MRAAVNYCFPAVVSTEGFIRRIEMVACVGPQRAPVQAYTPVSIEASSFLIYHPRLAVNVKFQQDVRLTGECYKALTACGDCTHDC